jgi:D-xylulose reductase
MERDALVIYAENDPLPGIARPGPHQTYRHPRVALEKRGLGPLAAEDLRVEMLYAGVCGTDLHLVQEDPRTGYLRTSSPALIPAAGRVFGHEGIGRVLEVGAGVPHLRPGAIVAFESIVVCHHCERCRRGLFNQCRHSQLLGMERDGLFATVADLPASLAHDVTELVREEKDAQALACLEPAGVAMVACRNGRIEPGHRVVIFGAGPIGLYCAMLARTVFAAGSICLVEPVAFRRKFAQRWADEVRTPEEFFAAPPEEIDVAIEASGDLTNAGRVVPHMNARGHIVLLARSGEPLTIEATDHLITNAVSITGSRGHLSGAFHTLLTLYRQGLFSPGGIITDVVDGLGAPGEVVQKSCKVLVRFKAWESA